MTRVRTAAFFPNADLTQSFSVRASLPGSIGADGRSESHDPNERMRWHSMLTYIAAERGYRSGWVAHKYKEKFGTWPAVRAIEPTQPTREVLSWVRSRNIAYAKAQQKAGVAA